MLPQILLSLGYLSIIYCRDVSKTVRSMPAITNSLVNLGKMDISFYFNTKSQDLPTKVVSQHPYGPLFSPTSEAIIEEPCFCSGVKDVKNSFLTNPSEMLNKILMSNDLFSFNKEPITSTLCCESHETIREDTAIIELNPRASQPSMSPTLKHPIPLPPFIFDNFITNKPFLPSSKPRAIEILFFPKNKEMTMFQSGKVELKKDNIKKGAIKVVGDKDVENGFNEYLKKSTSSSVKKDLAVQEKNDMKQSENININTTVIKPNTL